ncbi:MAG TPA: low-specificity L-threonine aldolase [Longilinea sp.]|nr:low-specificity L-threonine aldolase [Longilinea sp.]
MEYIDLRSDTVTQPTPAMRQAMASAVVGDDVLGEDPTVIRLQEIAAEKTGKEAALFVSSGTMGNLIAVLAVCGRGDAVIMGDLGHTFLFEGGGVSALGSVFPQTVKNQEDGTLLVEDIKAAIRPDDVHHPVTKQIVLENTQNRCGGAVLTPAYTQQVADLAHERNIHLHIDGARIFNAAAALQKPVKDLVTMADSVTFCLSKGLCAPVGSVLCGSKDLIGKARRLRKMLGGGMRQSGILAAAGIIAVEDMTSRLVEDHQRATTLAAGLSTVSGLKLSFGMPQTNMVFLEIDNQSDATAGKIAGQLMEKGIKVGVVGKKRFRLVTHYWIKDTDVETVIREFKSIM